MLKELADAVGGSVGARRTGYSHVIYNFFTGVLALLLISPYILAWEYLDPELMINNAEIALVGFHTTFNTLGVIAVLPFTRYFATLMERLVPEQPSLYNHNLDAALLEQPDLALSAVQTATVGHLTVLLQHVDALLGDKQYGSRADLATLQSALDETHAFLDRIHLDQNAGSNWQRLIALIHMLDHLQRLHERCDEEEDRADSVRKSFAMTDEKQSMVNGNREIIDAIGNKRWSETFRRAAKTTDHIEQMSSPYRGAIVTKIGSGKLDVAEGTGQLEAMRWLQRVSHHITRITHYLEQAVLSAGK